MSTAVVKEVLAKLADLGTQNLKLVPIIVVTDTPLSVNLNGDTGTSVSARSLTGDTLAVGATGFALWAPPLPPLAFLAQGNDTGWVDLTYEAGYTNANGQAAYRKIGNQVWLSGAADRTAGDFTTTAATVITLPVDARPAKTERFASYGTLGRTTRVEVNGATGAISVQVPNNGGTDEPFGWAALSHTYLTD